MVNLKQLFLILLLQIVSLNLFSQENRFNDTILFSKIDFLSIGEIHRDINSASIEIELIENFIRSHNQDSTVIFLEYSSSLNYFIKKYIETNDSTILLQYFSNWSNGNLTNYTLSRFKSLKLLIDKYSNNNKIKIVCIDAEKYSANVYDAVKLIFIENDMLSEFNKIDYSHSNNSKTLFIYSDSLLRKMFNEINKLNYFDMLNPHYSSILKNIEYGLIKKYKQYDRDSIMYSNIRTYIANSNYKSIFICGIGHNNKIYLEKLRLFGNTYKSTLSMLTSDKTLKQLNIVNVNIQYRYYKTNIDNIIHRSYFFAGIDSSQIKKIQNIQFGHNSFLLINCNKFFNNNYGLIDYIYLYDNGYLIDN